MSKALCWIEAMRLRTLPVSVAGVLTACAYAIIGGCFKTLPAILCLSFAVLAQIASNFANEYYDYKAGLDKPGREGPRRGVTEGDITPEAMRNATFGVLAVCAVIGCSLIYWGGWWLIAVGLTIGIGVLAYSTGPYPLSHHGLGEIAVVCFFGIIPVNMTFYLMSGAFDLSVFIGSLSLGLMGANVLIVNNYRDLEDDAAVSKKTLAVLLGRPFCSTLYLLNGWLAGLLMLPVWILLPLWGLAFPVFYLMVHTFVYYRLLSLRGMRLNPLLGVTAVLMLVYALGFLVTVAAF